MPRSRAYTGPLPSTDIDNGILARVPGEYIAQGKLSLPAAETAPLDVMTADVDTTSMWWGPVRLMFEKFKYRRPKGKFSAVIWVCVHAQQLD